MLATDDVWVSPGQWGSHAALAFLLASAGLLVVTRAARADVTFAFMAAWTGLLVARSLVAERADDHSAAPAGKRRLPALQLLHDLGPEDDARLARRPRALRRAGGARRRLRAVQAVPHQRLRVGAGLRLAVRPADRSAAARPPLRLGATPAARFHASLEPFTLHTEDFDDSHLDYHRGRGGLALAASAAPALAFCGFYVAKADTKLFNKASQVVLVRDGDRTVVTMSSDFKGDPKEFAMVVPVPTAIERGQINVGDKALVDHLDAFTAPRLVEYFDDNPCAVRRSTAMREMAAAAPAAAEMSRDAARAKSLGVTIEARYTVGEYDILILSATESRGLETWLRSQRLPHPGGRVGRPDQLHPPEHAVLRGQGEPGGAGEAGLLHAAPDPGGLRVAEVHAADPARHRERRRAAGDVRLHADAQGPRGDAPTTAR